MNDTKDKAVEDGNLPIERVGDYFKSLFVRSLNLGLDDGVRERPWEELSAPEVRSHTPASIETDSKLPPTGTASALGVGEPEEREAV